MVFGHLKVISLLFSVGSPTTYPCQDIFETSLWNYKEDQKRDVESILLFRNNSTQGV